MKYERLVLAVALFFVGLFAPDLVTIAAAKEFSIEDVGAILAASTAVYTIFQEHRHKKMHGSLKPPKKEIPQNENNNTF
ncbi:MAG: hypothetical protein KC589_08930 [Nanoarchaeota archaeon]|nr:hypothetical protein [Nanoarchaeota archaeon]